MTLSLSQDFHSLQGEGYWIGTQMHFIRLAGCSVGKKATNEFLFQKEQDEKQFGKSKLEQLPILSTGNLGSKCKTWDNRFFDCDTDFHPSFHKTVEELIKDTWEHHICLTGGEPLNHQQQLIVQGLFMKAFEVGIQIHIETSGTVKFDERLIHDKRIWITVSPKAGVLDEMIDRADELKLLVNEEFDVEKIPYSWRSKQHFFLSPVNDEHTLNKKNFDKTQEALKLYPDWRYTPQLHKYLGLE